MRFTLASGFALASQEPELQELARDQATDLTHLVRLEGNEGAKNPKISFATGETAKFFFATDETAKIFLASTVSDPDLSSYLGSRKNATSATRAGACPTT